MSGFDAVFAGLQHPYIARLLDGGVTAAGDLYLVMEYVDGLPIHQYCQQHQLTVAQRLELFLRVSEAERLSMTRIYNLLLIYEGDALVDIGEYAKANTLFEYVSRKFQSFSATDSQDIRSLSDLQFVLNNEAVSYEDAADPDLAIVQTDRRKNLMAAEKLRIQAMAIIEKGLKNDPADEEWQETLADAQVRLGTIQTILHSAGDPGLSKVGVTKLRELAGKQQVSSATLDDAAHDLLTVEPVSLRDPKFAGACAERSVALSHRHIPSTLLMLAQAYRAAGQIEKSRATANEGLALLPAPQLGSVKPRIRKLLEIQAQAGGSDSAG